MDTTRLRIPWPLLPASSLIGIALLCMAALPPSAAAAGQPVSVYHIRIKKMPIGNSRIVWHQYKHGRQSDALLRINGMLFQHQKLTLDAHGLPLHYRLAALVQGHETRISVRRTANAIIETVRQDGEIRTTHLHCPHPIDWLDNNSFDSLEALLERNRTHLKKSSVIPVFVPQARQLGSLIILRVKKKMQSTQNGRSRPVLSINARFTVSGKTVPLQLDVAPASGTLLRYRQPALGVSVTRTANAMPAP